MVTTMIRLRFDSHSTAIRPRYTTIRWFDDLRYDRRPTCVRAAAV